jgi:Ceramidase
MEELDFHHERPARGRRSMIGALAVLAGFCVSVAGVFWLLPPVAQDPAYHRFADRRTICGIPNFWNVVSNAPFLGVALIGLRSVRSRSSFTQSWERAAYLVLLMGVALVAFGSGYYHSRPNNATLFWDRLPMTIVFMCLLATIIGERINMTAGRLSLAPLLAIDVSSVLYWKVSGDLRLYGVVQFYPMLVIPLMLIFGQPLYSGGGGLAAMIGMYVVAKLFEQFDSGLGRFIATGGHPWKHLASAAAMLCYTAMVAWRRPLGERSRRSSFLGLSL